MKDHEETVAEAVGQLVYMLVEPVQRIAVALETLCNKERQKAVIDMQCENCHSSLIFADSESCPACNVCLDCGNAPGECTCKMPRRTALQIISEADDAVEKAKAEGGRRT